ncbi:MAG TPA: BON domain-containing protein [Opitutaceae bacterium]|jgi:osmotically-inducible protein OsmY
MTTSSLLRPALLLSAGLLIAGCASTPTKQSTGEYIDDVAITAKVKTALVKDDAVKSTEIKVDTFKGVVQLSGFVDNQDQRAAAERDATGVPGVRSVQDHIALKNG